MLEHHAPHYTFEDVEYEVEAQYQTLPEPPEPPEARNRFMYLYIPPDARVVHATSDICLITGHYA